MSPSGFFMNKEHCDTRRRATVDDLVLPGDYVIAEGMSATPGASHLMILLLPGEFSRSGPGVAVMPIRIGDASLAHVWGWDGNFERPTLKPSIENKGYWHGHLEAGRLRSEP